MVDVRHLRSAGLRPALRHIRASIPVGAANLGSRIKTNVDVLMLGMMAGAQAVGYYSAAYRLVYFVQTFAGLYATVLMPRVARALAGETDGAHAVIHTSMRSALAVATGLIGIVVPLGSGIMALLFGAEYSEASTVFAPLIGASAFLVVSMTLGHAALGLRHDGFYASAAWAAAIMNIALNLVTIPAFGIRGAAISTLVTEIGLSVAFVFRLWGAGVRETLTPRVIFRLAVQVTSCAAVGRVSLAVTGSVVVSLVLASCTWVVFALALGLISPADVSRLKRALR